MDISESIQEDNNPQDKKQNKKNYIQGDEGNPIKQVTKAIDQQLDMEFIKEKQKDPEEWKKFLKKGRALYELIHALTASDSK